MVELILHYFHVRTPLDHQRRAGGGVPLPRRRKNLLKESETEKDA